MQEVLYPPYFDQNQFSIPAEILQIPSLVNPLVQEALAKLPSGTSTSTTPQACYSLGDSGDAYYVDLFPTQKVSPVTAATALQQMSVRVLEVDRSTTSAYEPLETPSLYLWAGYSTLRLDLPPMAPGQTWVPTTNAVIETPIPPSDGQLVVIADIVYNDLNSEDSTFAVFGKSSNFGSGTQKLTVQKSWFMPAQNGNKPYKVYADGYYVTLQISGPPNTSTMGSVSTPVTPVTPVRPIIPIQIGAFRP